MEIGGEFCEELSRILRPKLGFRSCLELCPPKKMGHLGITAEDGGIGSPSAEGSHVGGGRRGEKGGADSAVRCRKGAPNRSS